MGDDKWLYDIEGGLFMRYLKKLKTRWHNFWSNRYRIVLENNQIIDVLIYRKKVYVNVSKI